MSYVVTAFCSRPWCHVKEFTSLRENLSFQDGEGTDRSISRVRCPRCSAMSPIVKTQEVA